MGAGLAIGVEGFDSSNSLNAPSCCRVAVVFYQLCKTVSGRMYGMESTFLETWFNQGVRWVERDREFHPETIGLGHQSGR